MTDDELDRYAKSIDAGKMEGFHFTWAGVIFRAFVVPMGLALLLGAATFGVMWWLQ